MAGSRSIPFLLFLFLFPYMLFAQPVEEIDWHYEIDLLGSELARRHCNLFFQSDSTSFFSALDLIAQRTPQKSLFDISVELQQVLAGMGDAHTSINYHFNIEGNTILPLSLYWFEDGLYVLKCAVKYREILGKRLLAINGYPLGQIIDSMATLLVSGNPYLLKSQFPRMVTWTPLLDHFGFSGRKDFELTFEKDRETVEKLMIQLSEKDGEMVDIQTEKLPLGWEDQKSYFRDCYFPDERIYYLQYNKCWSREAEEEFGSGASALFMPSFKAFEKKVFQTIKRQKIDKLVFDMRFNGGGNASQGTQFIRKLSKTRINGIGDIFVIVGRQTSAAAIINTVDFLNCTEALIVGEGTGGRPNHFGEVKRFVLPESKLVVNCSTHYYMLMEEDPPYITPDIETPIHFNQFMKGIDPAMEAIRVHPSSE